MADLQQSPQLHTRGIGPTVSVVMPLYNCGPYVKAAVTSVLAQTLGDFELVVGDDGSADEGPQIVAELAASDPRIRLLRLPHGGIGATMNALLAEAVCEEIAIMHADDIMLPQRLERQHLYLAEHPEIAVVSSDVYYINARGRCIGSFRSNLRQPGEFRARADAGRPECFHHPAAMVRKSIVLGVGGYHSVPAEDLNLWLRITERGHDVSVMPEPLLCYRIHSGQTSIRQFRSVFLQEQLELVNYLNRRRGLPEMKVEDWTKEMGRWPLSRRLGFQRGFLSQVLYKRSAANYAHGHLVRSLIYGLAALLFAPYSVPRTIANKLRV